MPRRRQGPCQRGWVWRRAPPVPLAQSHSRTVAQSHSRTHSSRDSRMSRGGDVANIRPALAPYKDSEHAAEIALQSPARFEQTTLGRHHCPMSLGSSAALLPAFRRYCGNWEIISLPGLFWSRSERVTWTRKHGANSHVPRRSEAIYTGGMGVLPSRCASATRPIIHHPPSCTRGHDTLGCASLPLTSTSERICRHVTGFGTARILDSSEYRIPSLPIPFHPFPSLPLACSRRSRRNLAVDLPRASTTKLIRSHYRRLGQLNLRSSGLVEQDRQVQVRIFRGTNGGPMPACAILSQM
ncbi:hypothetical protein BJ546DRAFT_163363 [Cryomyces antarcticus]